MADGPVPSKLTFLTSLPFHAPGVKVRFLGCVQSYHPSTGTLLLAHDFPRGSAAHLGAAVDARHILDSLTHDSTRVGEWVNIVGYVTGKHTTPPVSTTTTTTTTTAATKPPTTAAAATATAIATAPSSSTTHPKTGSANGSDDGDHHHYYHEHIEVRVQGLSLWPAGPMDLGEYERSLVQQGIEQVEREEQEDGAGMDDDEHEHEHEQRENERAMRHEVERGAGRASGRIGGRA